MIDKIRRLLGLPSSRQTGVVSGRTGFLHRPVRPGAPRTYLVVRYDVTGLTDEEVSALTLEAVVQGEASEYHPTVPVDAWGYTPLQTRENHRRKGTRHVRARHSATKFP